MAKQEKREVLLLGTRPIMFDRYPGNNDIELSPAEKIYFAKDGKTLVLPVENVYSLLCAENTRSVAKMMFGRKYKEIASYSSAFTTIDPIEIPFTRGGKPIVFSGFDEDEVDKKARLYIDRRVARVDKGIPNPKVRPVLSEPWELKFTVMLYSNDKVDIDLLHRMFIFGGVALGLGTYRGVYGKFEVAEWK